MLILALDGATAQPSIALWRDGVTLAALRQASAEPGSTMKSDALPLRAEALLAQAGLAFAALDRLAVTIGPGRFTGLRASLAFMRGLALALGAPLIGVTTLEALRPRRRAAPGEVTLASIGSGRAELFFAIDDGPAFACLPADLEGHLPRDAAVAVVGDALAGLSAADSWAIVARLDDESAENSPWQWLVAGRPSCRDTIPIASCRDIPKGSRTRFMAAAYLDSPLRDCLSR